MLRGVAGAEKRWAEGKGSGKQPLLDIEQAIALDAHNVEFYTEWARIATRGGVARHKILARLKEAQKLFPEHAELYFLRAREYVPSQYETALNEIDRAIALAPDRAAYHAQRADIQAQALSLKSAKIDTARALADSQRAAELEPANPDYVIGHAQWLSRAGKIANARAEFERAIQLNPKRAESYRARASWLEQQGDYARALEDFTRAIELEPQRGVYYWWRGICYRRKGERAAARRDFEQAVAHGWSLAEWDLKSLK